MIFIKNRQQNPKQWVKTTWEGSKQRTGRNTVRFHLKKNKAEQIDLKFIKDTTLHDLDSRFVPYTVEDFNYWVSHQTFLCRLGFQKENSSLMTCDLPGLPSECWITGKHPTFGFNLTF